MGYETTVKHKVHGINITNTTNLVPVRTPVPIPLAWKFYWERIIILTQLALFMFFFFRACFIKTNPWVNPMMMSGQGTVPKAIPADYYESAQEILVVMNPPVGQLVADVPNKKPAEC